MSDSRKRKHNWNSHTRQKSVEPGLSGLLFTCDGHEKEAVREAYNVIDAFFEDQTGLVSEEEVDEDEDVTDTLKRVCKEGREAGDQKKKRCRQRPTGVKNCIFVTVQGSDVVSLAGSLVDRAQSAASCRYLQRALPVEETTNVGLKEMNDLITKLVSRHLVKNEADSFPSYALEFKARNNDQIKKSAVLEMLNDAVSMIAPAAKVDLTNPEITFFLQVVRKSIMGGVAKNFTARKKYSMRVNGCEKEPKREKKEKKTEEEVVEE